MKKPLNSCFCALDPPKTVFLFLKDFINCIIHFLPRQGIWIEQRLPQFVCSVWLDGLSQGFLNNVKAFSSASSGTQMGNRGHASAASQGSVRNVQLYGPQVGNRGHASAAPQGSARNVHGSNRGLDLRSFRDHHRHNRHNDHNQAIGGGWVPVSAP